MDARVNRGSGHDQSKFSKNYDAIDWGHEHPTEPDMGCCEICGQYNRLIEIGLDWVCYNNRNCIDEITDWYDVELDRFIAKAKHEDRASIKAGIIRQTMESNNG